MTKGLKPMKRAHKVLTLADKIKVIDVVNEGLNNSQVAAKFGCGRSQIANILLNKKAIIDALHQWC